MNKFLDAALGYARRGWKVFPLHGVLNGVCTCGRSDCGSAGKHPLVRRGLYEATTDSSFIDEWWRQWPSANIGVATGATSGIAVVDIDLPAAAPMLDLLLAQGLEPTLTGLTGGGGVHLIYRCSGESLGNSVGRLPGSDEDLPGIDLRANGGYIVVPPSVHASGETYSWLDPTVPIAGAPSWLRQPPPREIRIPEAPPFVGDGTPYGLAALEALIAEMRGAREGERNHTLYRTARRITDLIATGHLSSPSLDQLAEAACCSGLGTHEITRTIDSAHRSGVGAAH